METVGRYEGFEAQVVDVAPIPHDIKAPEQVDVFVFGGGRDKGNHILRLGL
jgi:hypothetical protein